MAWKFGIFLSVLGLAILIRKVQIKIEKLSLPPGYSFNDQSCHLVGQDIGMMGSEDLALGKHSILFITSGLNNVWEHGPASSPHGGIFIMDPRPGVEKKPVKVEIEGFPAGKLIHAHGFDLSNATDRLYVVNHHIEHSSVEVINIKYDTSCVSSSPWSCPPVRLQYVKSISSDLFPRMGINDVVEVDDNHLYVSQWQVFGFPVNGKKNPGGFLELLKAHAELPFIMFSLKFTTVFLCSVKDGNCEAATEEKFVGANGITINKNRDKVFVNDPSEKVVTIMKRDGASYKLIKDSEIKLPVAIDNLEYDDDNDEILMGTIPDAMAIAKKMMDPSVKIPGGMALASKQESGWKVRDMLEHDGRKLDQISAAARFGSTVILGSPFAEGLLVCDNIKY